MNNRIKQVREYLKLTQDEFGKKIGSARNTIANYENGNRNPSNAVIISICREFHVSEEWLRNGTGDMFVNRTISLSEIPHFNDLPPNEQKMLVDIVNAYLDLDDISREALMTIINKMVETRKGS